APSTQPPETLPTTSPSEETARAAPGSLGALLNVWTTVASPNVSPASHHLPIWSRMSRTIGHLRPLELRDMPHSTWLSTTSVQPDNGWVNSPGANSNPIT